MSASTYGGPAHADQLTRAWETKAHRALVGRRIVEARYMSQAEADALGFHSRAPVLVLDDGTALFPQADDEGNDAGALALVDVRPDKATHRAIPPGTMACEIAGGLLPTL